jgi:hypothetical protein
MDSMRDAAGMGDARSELLSLQEMGTAVGQVTRDAIAGSISAAIAGQMSLAKATKMAVGQALAAQAQTWIVRGGMELLFGNPRGAAIVAGGVAALALARSLGGGSSGSGSAPGGTVPGGGFVPFGGPGLGGQLGPSGPSSVTFNLRGRDPRENAVIFDKAYRDAKRAGMIPDGDGPSRLVG